MADERQEADESSSNVSRPNSLGTGIHSPSTGTVSLDSSPTSSHDDMPNSSLRTSADDEERRRQQVHVRSSRTTTAGSSSSPPAAALRERVYSEEDEELRKAKAMALAIQQHPNMTPDEIHRMHIGDEAQLSIIITEQQHHQQQVGGGTKQPPTASSKSNDSVKQAPSSIRSESGSSGNHFVSAFRESQEKAKKNFRESQEKAKQKFKSMVGPKTTSSASEGTTTPRASSTSTAAAAAAVAAASSSLSTSVKSTTSATETAPPSRVTTTNAISGVDKGPLVSPAAAAKRAVEKSPVAAKRAVIAEKAVVAKHVVGNAATTAKGAAGTAATNAKGAAGTAAANAKGAAGTAAANAKGAAGTAAANAKAVIHKTTSMSSDAEVEVVESKSTDSGKAAEVGAGLDKGEKIRLSAVVWKRRSGFGKLSYTKAWEKRRIILQGSKLFYFKMTEGENDELMLDSKEASWFEQAAQNLDKPKGPWLATADDPSAPRGYFDLLKEGATVGASSGHSGAPSPFAISIKVKSDTYWKLCFDSHATQMDWLAAMTDVIVNASVDEYNANLLLQADPRNEPSMFGTEYLPPPGDKGAGQQLWMLGEYRVSSEGLGEKEVAVVEKLPEAVPSTAMLDELHEVDRWILRDMDVRTLFAIVNAALVLSRASLTMPQQFWYVLTFCNVGLWFCLVKGYKKKSSRPPSVAAISVEKSLVEITEIEEEIPAVKPVAGTTTVKLENPSDSPERNGQVFGAWCAPGGENIAVRSHGYLTTKEKVPSPGELYTLANVDIFESPHRYPDMAKRVVLPEVSFEGGDPSPKTWYAPDVFIVSVALPTDPPKMRSTNDGGGFTITMYYTMQQETRDILRRVTAESYDPLQEPQPDDVQKGKVNAVKLFNDYCRRAPNDPAFQSRFKVVANAQNLKEIGMPTWIAKYNGKPVLIKRPGETGFLFPHPELSCMEFDVSFHPFPYLAKQAISYMKDNFFKKVLVTFAFVIEGRSDDELPECVIGLMQLCYPNPIYAIQAADFFAGKSPKSF